MPCGGRQRGGRPCGRYMFISERSCGSHVCAGEFCCTASRTTRQGNGVADCVSGECLSCADGAFAGGDFSWGLCIDGSWPVNRKLLPFCILMEYGKEQLAGQTNCGRRVAVLCSAVLASSEFGLGWRVGKVDPG